MNTSDMKYLRDAIERYVALTDDAVSGLCRMCKANGNQQSLDEVDSRHHKAGAELLKMVNVMFWKNNNHQKNTPERSSIDPLI